LLQIPVCLFNHKTERKSRSMRGKRTEHCEREPNVLLASRVAPEEGDFARDDLADPGWSTTELELHEPPDGFALTGNDLCLPD
jgi:hypothetical protein